MSISDPEAAPDREGSARPSTRSCATRACRGAGRMRARIQTCPAPADAGLRTIQEPGGEGAIFTLEEVVHGYSYAVAQKWGLKDQRGQ